MFFDYYLPQEETKQVPAVYENIEKSKKSIFDIKPTKADYQYCAKSIHEIFADGFQWYDLASIMKLSLQYLNNFFSLSIQEKRLAVQEIINYVIDETDTPYLPDVFFDPIFKILVPSFVELIIPDSIDEIIPLEKIAGNLSIETISDFILQIENDCSGYLHWEDVAKITRRTIKFVNQYIEVTVSEKKEKAKEIIEKVLKNTNMSYLPDFFVDNILKDISHGFVDHIINAVDSIAIF